MAFPAEGVERAYRNDIDEVVKLLEQEHGEHYLIFNLSQRPYDYAKFKNRVVDWCGFPDHHNPPLALLFRTLKALFEFLVADNKNVVVIHCNAGKGRTGTVIACLLLMVGMFRTAEAAIAFFGSKRSRSHL